MNVRSAANHGVHSEHGEKAAFSVECFAPLPGELDKLKKLKVFAVPAVFAVVKQKF